MVEPGLLDAQPAGLCFPYSSAATAILTASAEPLAEIPPGAALGAWWRRERPAGQALLTEIDSRSGPRDPSGLTGVAARRGARHRGGSGLAFPKRGLTTGGAPSVLAGDLTPGTLRSIERDLEPCLGPKWLTK